MQVEIAKKLFTADEYNRMAEAGILGPEDHVELIDGEIIQMSPIGVRHVGFVSRANDLFITTFKGKVVVGVQCPIQLTNYTEPEPDISLLKWRKDYYQGKRAEAEDALLVVEVSDTTLRYDREIKVPLYAAAGVPEVWIEDINGDQLLVFRDPAGNNYTTTLTLRRGDSVSVLAFPETIFKVDDILG